MPEPAAGAEETAGGRAAPAPEPATAPGPARAPSWTMRRRTSCAASWLARSRARAQSSMLTKLPGLLVVGRRRSCTGQRGCECIGFCRRRTRQEGAGGSVFGGAAPPAPSARACAGAFPCAPSLRRRRALRRWTRRATFASTRRASTGPGVVVPPGGAYARVALRGHLAAPTCAASPVRFVGSPPAAASAPASKASLPCTRGFALRSSLIGRQLPVGVRVTVRMPPAGSANARARLRPLARSRASRRPLLGLAVRLARGSRAEPASRAPPGAATLRVVADVRASAPPPSTRLPRHRRPPRSPKICHESWSSVAWSRLGAGASPARRDAGTGRCVGRWQLFDDMRRSACAPTAMCHADSTEVASSRTCRDGSRVIGGRRPRSASRAVARSGGNGSAGDAMMARACTCAVCARLLDSRGSPSRGAADDRASATPPKGWSS